MVVITKFCHFKQTLQQLLEKAECFSITLSVLNSTSISSADLSAVRPTSTRNIALTIEVVTVDLLQLFQ